MTDVKEYSDAVVEGIRTSWLRSGPYPKDGENAPHPLDTALGKSLHGDHDGAEAILRSLDSSDPRVAFNLGWHEYRKGNWKSGAVLQDSGRWINVIGSPPLGSGAPIWNGEPLMGKTVLLRLEGGLGDEICGYRWVTQLSHLGARVVVSCHSSLARLFSRRRSDPHTVAHEGARYVYHDYWIPAMSATRWFEPSGGAYIWKARPRTERRTKKIGIRWSGNPQFEHQQHRRFPPELMIGLTDTQNAQFYSFQRDTDLKPLPGNVIDLANSLKTWEDTFNALAEMDLVITSCTSVAHAAAAMGVPTWVVVPILPYSTWAMPGDRTPWYDSVRLYRQEQYGDWLAPFTRIRKDLAKLCST